MAQENKKFQAKQRLGEAFKTELYRVYYSYSCPNNAMTSTIIVLVCIHGIVMTTLGIVYYVQFCFQSLTNPVILNRKKLW